MADPSARTPGAGFGEGNRLIAAMPKAALVGILPHPELVPTLVAGIEHVVPVGVERLAERRHIRRGAARPLSEDDLLGLVDDAVRPRLPIGAEINGEDAVVGSAPGGVPRLAGSGHVKARRRGTAQHEIDPVAVEVKDDWAVETKVRFVANRIFGREHARGRLRIDSRIGLVGRLGVLPVSR